jgi:NADPH:quinone reductase-like Zn-dependent oxidoreductase
LASQQSVQTSVRTSSDHPAHFCLGYGTTGLSVGQRVFGLTDWSRDGTLAEYAAVEARNLAPLPGDVDFTVGASLPISGLTAWQGLIVHGRLRAGQRVIAHGAAGAVGSMVTQLAQWRALPHDFPP